MKYFLSNCIHITVNIRYCFLWGYKFSLFDCSNILLTMWNILKFKGSNTLSNGLQLLCCVSEMNAQWRSVCVCFILNKFLIHIVFTPFFNFLKTKQLCHEFVLWLYFCLHVLSVTYLLLSLCWCKLFCLCHFLNFTSFFIQILCMKYIPELDPEKEKTNYIFWCQ